MKELIQLNIRHKLFNKGTLSILNNFQLSVLSGDKIAVMGESGVGKTSLLNILGLIDSDYEGEYTLFQDEAKSLTSKQRAVIRNKNIGFVLQENSLIDSLSIEENIKLPLLYTNEPNKKEIEEHFQLITHKMDIEPLLAKKPLECSGGQRSRAAIARAILMKPDIILADEPTASLDEKNKLRVLELLDDINENYGSTIITVTHDRSVADHHDRIIEMERED
ncbi:ABC transporter ATP-binding protein [Marinilactibacillus psychrotolerans]|uniref:Antimicrobial peptide ABC transporter ATP-binding protein n=1 Tax=Marinilactibacillus psychrotolerans TaxID=191770 RepID=A0AAV3WQR3_9LACT|nr:ABC transporter ATP-binding protein [Marinilactibacillus psychrotolerans]GEL66813.1 ABC transporter ATP-binding protein [Marinilactibacillus psychrotolerans]GEQ35740.1 antimicrobial peptide ABC transporter ATP-binding protein [Marinilactibacillus psychrotolerans]SDC35524.1 putative ABC transport system ATP-binding protein [Marinilactibacillus psychrotolerans]